MSSEKTNRKDFLCLVNHLSKLLGSDFDRRLSDHSLTWRQGRLLFFVNRMNELEHKEVHQNDIEVEFQLSKSTVSGLVKRLEKRELIQVDRSHKYAVLSVTDQGKAILNHIKTTREEFLNNLLKDISSEDYKQLTNTLNLLIDKLEGGKDNAS